MLDRLLRRFVRVTYVESPAALDASTVTVHLIAWRRMPRRVVYAVAYDWLAKPARLLKLRRSCKAGQINAKWVLTFDTGHERNDHA